MTVVRTKAKSSTAIRSMARSFGALAPDRDGVHRHAQRAQLRARLRAEPVGERARCPRRRRRRGRRRACASIRRRRSRRRQSAPRRSVRPPRGGTARVGARRRRSGATSSPKVAPLEVHPVGERLELARGGRRGTRRPRRLRVGPSGLHREAHRARRVHEDREPVADAGGLQELDGRLERGGRRRAPRRPRAARGARSRRPGRVSPRSPRQARATAAMAATGEQGERPRAAAARAR